MKVGRVLTLWGALSVLFLGTLCAGAQANTQAATGGGGVTNASGIAAIVNGEAITVQEWVTRMQNLRAQDFLLVGPTSRFKTTNAGQIALEALVLSRLLVQYATKTSLLPSDAELTADLQAMKQQPSVQQALANKQLTEEQLRGEIRLQKALFNVVTINQRVTEAEARAYYDRHPEVYRPERWDLAVIRTSSKESAEKVLAALKKGTPFADVAKQYSEDATTKAIGGRMGRISAYDPNLPAFIRDAVRKMSVGDLSPLLQAPTPAGQKQAFYLLRLVGKEESSQSSFERVRAQVERAALFEKSGGTEAAEQKLAEFRRASNIVVNLPYYQDIFKNRP